MTHVSFNVACNASHTAYSRDKTFTGTGALICIGYVVLGLWFFKDVRESYRTEVESAKRGLYQVLTISVSFYFFVLPVMALAALGISPPWRRKVVEG